MRLIQVLHLLQAEPILWYYQLTMELRVRLLKPLMLRLRQMWLFLTAHKQFVRVWQLLILPVVLILIPGALVVIMLPLVTHRQFSYLFGNRNKYVNGLFKNGNRKRHYQFNHGGDRGFYQYTIMWSVRRIKATLTASGATYTWNPGALLEHPS